MCDRERRGFSLIELLIVIAIILIIVTVAVPQLQNVLKNAHAMAAAKAIQTINTAQIQYNTTYGRFAQSLSELSPPPNGSASASTADLIPPDLATGEKQGYRFALTGTPSGYTISAVPTMFGSTGSSTFYSDQTMLIRENRGREPATATSPLYESAAAGKPST